MQNIRMLYFIFCHLVLEYDLFRRYLQNTIVSKNKLYIRVQLTYIKLLHKQVLL